MGDTNGSELHVIFGTGPVGMSIMDELVAKRKRVRMINRSGKANVPENVEVIAGDAMDCDFTRGAAEGATVIYNALNPPYDKWLELFPPLQKSVLEAAASVGAKLIVMENVYMYGNTHGKPIHEDMPYARHTKKGFVRALMAEELLAAHQSGFVRIAMGRASDFFGPRVKVSATGEQVFRAALAGRVAQVIGNPDMPHTYTYMPDIGKALVILGEREEALGTAWHIPSAATFTTRQFIDMIFKEAGNEPKYQVAPKLLLRILGLFKKPVGEVVEMLYEFEEPFIVDHSKFEHTFGNHATPLEEAIKTTVKWFREN